jgi:hypothetical protein
MSAVHVYPVRAGTAGSTQYIFLLVYYNIKSVVVVDPAAAPYYYPFSFSQL